MKYALCGLGAAVIAVLAMVLVPAANGAPQAGEAAPDFRLQDQHGDWHALGEYRGKWVALYFYPRDDTPGCTTEACAFRDNIFAFRELGAEIVGVSLDDVNSHKEFADKHSLPFTLLADPEGETARSYGVLRNLGVTSVARRESFLIDPHGQIVKHYGRVDPDEHSEEVLRDLESFMAQGPTEQ